jgi:hypothetical protein
MGNPSLEADSKDEQQYIEELIANTEQFAEEEKRLVRKIDLFLLPTIWIMYLLSYMDRTKYVLLIFGHQWSTLMLFQVLEMLKSRVWLMR